MASNPFNLHTHTINDKPSSPFPLSKTLHQLSTNLNRTRISIFPIIPLKLQSLTIFASLSSSSSSSSPSPPTSRQEAILQAKTSLLSTLKKPLNDPNLIIKSKKQNNQSRYRVEIPVVDESPDSITRLAFEVFGDFPVRRKGSQVRILMIWGNPILREKGVEAFGSVVPLGGGFEHGELGSVMTVYNRFSNWVDLVVFLAPTMSGLGPMKRIVESLDSKAVVLFNPSWRFEEESDFGEKMRGFVRSFEVVYAFLGLEVRGIFSKRNGVVFKCVRDGVLIDENWSVFVEEDGRLKVVSRFKSRPSIAEVESVLYNLIAANSPVTKSVKFFRNLVSNVMGKK
ncbi:hypothetical protein Droror1_Dr00015909 [Drosera rotundifolia]